MHYINAKRELLLHHNSVQHAYKISVKCAECSFISDDDMLELITLPCGYTAEEFEVFVNKLNIMYNNELDDESEYDEFSLTGTLWWTDGSWSVRDYWMDQETWMYFRTPDIPYNLKRKSSDNIVQLFKQ